MFLHPAFTGTAILTQIGRKELNGHGHAERPTRLLLQLPRLRLLQEQLALPPASEALMDAAHALAKTHEKHEHGCPKDSKKQRDGRTTVEHDGRHEAEGGYGWLVRLGRAHGLEHKWYDAGDNEPLQQARRAPLVRATAA